MRFHVVWRKSHEPESAYRDFFETNDIGEAKMTPETALAELDRLRGKEAAQ